MIGKKTKKKKQSADPLIEVSPRVLWTGGLQFHDSPKSDFSLQQPPGQQSLDPPVIKLTGI